MMCLILHRFDDTSLNNNIDVVNELMSAVTGTYTNVHLLRHDVTQAEFTEYGNNNNLGTAKFALEIKRDIWCEIHGIGVRFLAARETEYVK